MFMKQCKMHIFLATNPLKTALMQLAFCFAPMQHATSRSSIAANRTSAQLSLYSYLLCQCTQRKYAAWHQKKQQEEKQGETKQNKNIYIYIEIKMSTCLFVNSLCCVVLCGQASFLPSCLPA